MTSIRPCSCTSKYQDEKYGQMKRVHNSAKSSVSTRKAWRCTVCGTKKDGD